MSISSENKRLANIFCRQFEESVRAYYPEIGNDRALGNFDEDMMETERHVQRLEYFRNGFCNVKTDQEFTRLRKEYGFIVQRDCEKN